jgi:hypothetical protein
MNWWHSQIDLAFVISEMRGLDIFTCDATALYGQCVG